MGQGRGRVRVRLPAGLGFWPVSDKGNKGERKTQSSSRLGRESASNHIGERACVCMVDFWGIQVVLSVRGSSLIKPVLPQVYHDYSHRPPDCPLEVKGKLLWSISEVSIIG